ncbi:MAG: hypothetical protein AB7N80_07655 [Bdellovibrionales bacterium]
MKTVFLFPAIVITLALTACQTVPYEGQAREVKRKPQQEGVIALETNHRSEDRAKADEKMKSNCAPYPVNILEEGEVVTGQATTTNASETNRASSQKKVGSLFGIPVTTGQASGTDTSTSSTTTALKEWQISYTCDKKATAKR